METLHLYWSNPLYFWDLYDEDKYEEKLEESGVYYEKGIYIVVGRRKIIYVGQTYDQTFKIRLRQHMNSPKWKCIRKAMRDVSTANPFIKCAYLEEYYSRQRIDAIENLLIFIKEPPCCDRLYRTYNKRRPLKVVNRGNPFPLQDSYYTEDYADLM